MNLLHTNPNGGQSILRCWVKVLCQIKLMDGRTSKFLCANQRQTDSKNAHFQNSKLNRCLFQIKFRCEDIKYKRKVAFRTIATTLILFESCGDR